jgi:hypothetical protein
LLNGQDDPADDSKRIDVDDFFSDFFIFVSIWVYVARTSFRDATKRRISVNKARLGHFPTFFPDLPCIVWTALSVRQVLLDLRQCLADLFPEVPPHKFGEILIAVALGDWRSSRGASLGMASRAGW